MSSQEFEAFASFFNSPTFHEESASSTMAADLFPNANTGQMPNDISSHWEISNEFDIVDADNQANLTDYNQVNAANHFQDYSFHQSLQSGQTAAMADPGHGHQYSVDVNNFNFNQQWPEEQQHLIPPVDANDGSQYQQHLPQAPAFAQFQQFQQQYPAEQPQLQFQQLSPHQSPEQEYSQGEPVVSEDIQDSSQPERSQSTGGEPVPISRVTVASGPMSRDVHLPARPKPGRKPINGNDSVDRRRLQNRIAQRNFRDKRQQKLAECQQELQDMKQVHESQIREMTIQHDKKLKQRDETIKTLSARVHELEQKYGAAHSLTQLGRSGRAANLSVSSLVNESDEGRRPRTFGPLRSPSTELLSPTSTMKPQTTLETDFTNAFRAHGHSQSMDSAQAYTPTFGHNPSASSDSTRDFTESFGKCGFCEQGRYCHCKEAQHEA